MRSVASYKSHPLHPMLIAFPIAFLVGAFVCNVVGWAAGSEAWWRTGAWLAVAGMISAVVAAVPGVIDYIYAIPPGSSAKRRATWHMSVNLAAVALFLVAWIVRGSAEASPTAVTMLLELVALGLLSSGGWMGGTLVYRNFIGPEHRYANTGKWRDQTIERTPGEESVIVADADELDIDQMKLIRVDGRRIVLARSDRGYSAFDDRCSHRGGSLADGVMICGTVQCLWHGSQFDVHTGQPRCGPAKQPIRTYTVEQRDGKVHLLTENL